MSIPTFNLQELLHPSRSLSASFLECLQAKGIFYLSHSGLLDADHTPARETCLSFFHHASDTAKQSVTLQDSTARRGFSSLGRESTAVVTNTGSFTDYSREPFRLLWQDYFDGMSRTCRQVARVVLEASGAEEPHGAMDAFLDRCEPLLRLRYFPDVPPERDLSVITLIHQTACRNGFVSLQCELDDGRFVDVPTRDDTMVVLCGAIKAPRHRVTAPDGDHMQGSSRTSSVFFLRPEGTFRFSVPLAREWGFDVRIPAETATFGDWLGGNYVNMRVEGGDGGDAGDADVDDADADAPIFAAAPAAATAAVA
ncbi:hypothetical protein E4U54_001741 [Claviceps lovelessii]|nr:hypothetical protein E4U54_001741 [Claviceps lovelessii]